MQHFLMTHVSKHAQGKHDVLFDGHGVKKSAALENHTYLLTQLLAGIIVHVAQQPVGVIYLSTIWTIKAQKTLEKDGLSAAAAAND